MQDKTYKMDSNMGDHLHVYREYKLAISSVR